MRIWTIILLLITYSKADSPSVGLDHTLNHPEMDLSLLVTNEENQTFPLQNIAEEKPIVLGFVYFGCASMCILFLDGLLSTLDRSPKDYLPGKEYHLAVLSIDPEETSSQAKLKKEAALPSLKISFHNNTGAF